MFDIGFPELLLVAVVMLLVLGPERLPVALRTAGLWIGRLQRSFNSVKTEIEREIGMDDIRRQLHNESVMAEMRKLEEDLKSGTDPRLNTMADSNSILPEDSLQLDEHSDSEALAADAPPAEEALAEAALAEEKGAEPDLSTAESQTAGSATAAAESPKNSPSHGNNPIADTTRQ